MEKMLKQRRVPEGTLTQMIDSNLELLITDACTKLIKGSNPRRCRRIAGLLTEFRDLPGSDQKMFTYYQRLAMEVLLAEIAER